MVRSATGKTGMETHGLVQARIIAISGRIIDAASRDSGLIITYQNSTYPHRLGFSFLSAKLPDNMVAIHAFAGTLSDPLSFTLYCQSGTKTWENFVLGYLERTASRVDINCAEVIFALEQIQPWRFLGFVDKKSSHLEDNSRIWRVLWGRIIEAATSERLLLVDASDIDAKAVELAICSLRSCATEGQIVLDR